MPWEKVASASEGLKNIIGEWHLWQGPSLNDAQTCIFFDTFIDM